MFVNHLFYSFFLLDAIVQHTWVNDKADPAHECTGNCRKQKGRHFSSQDITSRHKTDQHQNHSEPEDHLEHRFGQVKGTGGKNCFQQKSHSR